MLLFVRRVKHALDVTVQRPHDADTHVHGAYRPPDELHDGCPPSAQRRTNATSPPAQPSNSNQHQRVHIAAARSSLRTRNENASSCIRLCIARPSHLDRMKFIRNFSRIDDQCSRSIQRYRSVNGIPRHRVYGRPRRGRRLAMGRLVGQPGNDQIGPSREQGHRYT